MAGIKLDHWNLNMIADILVHLDASETCQARMDAAITLARRHNAKLIGLFAFEVPAIPSYAQVRMPNDLLAGYRAGYLAQAEESQQIFVSTTEAAGIAGEWRQAEGYPSMSLELHGRYTDIIVMGQPHRDGITLVNDNITPQVIIESSKPVLVIPQAGVADDGFGYKIMVAWNGSRQAVRAIDASLTLLQAAERVDVVAINPQRDGQHGELPTADICKYLARHEVNARGQSVSFNDWGVGKSLLGWASENGNDLIVMGGYGHSRFRELVLGGATQHVLDHSPLPVLMCH